MSVPYVCRACCRRALILPSRAHRRHFTNTARSFEDQTNSEGNPFDQNATVDPFMFDILSEDTLTPVNARTPKKDDTSFDSSLEKLFAGDEAWKPTRVIGKRAPSGIEIGKSASSRIGDAVPSQRLHAGLGEPRSRLLRYSKAPVKLATPDEDATISDKRALQEAWAWKRAGHRIQSDVILEKHYLKLEQLRETVNADPTTLPTIWQQTAETLRSLSQALPKHIVDQKEILGFLRYLVTKTADLGGFKGAEGTVIPADILKTYKECNITKSWWHYVLWIQLRNLIEGKVKSAGRISNQKLDLAWRTLEVYAKLHSPGFVQQGGVTASEDPLAAGQDEMSQPIGSTTSSNGHGRGIAEASSKRPLGVYARFLDTFGGDSRINAIVENKRASAALLLLHYIELHLLESGNHIKMEPEVLQRLRLVGQGMKFDCASFIHCLKDVRTPEAIIEREVASWMESPIESIRQADFLKPLQPVPKDGSTSFTETQRLHFFERANRIARSEDSYGANNLWNKLKPLLQSDSLTEDDKHKIVSRFLTLFNELRMMDRSTEVWNLMVDIGLPPDKRHWNAMITGCSRVRDTESLQTIWENMLRASIVPDNNLWAAFIQGIIRAGKFDHGLVLLEHVGRLWSSPNHPLEPDLAPIHTALSAINELRGSWGRNAKITKQNLVLNWARSHSLTPSTHTYNILLERLAPVGDPQEIQHHLDNMASDNATPDVITWTLILKGLVSPNSPFFSLYPETQTETISSILNSMSSNRCHPSGPTYSTLLFGLLDAKYRPPNIAAARCVLDHMDAAGLQPSEHIHTIILTHYFSSSPPDLHSANALLNRLVSPMTKSSKISNVKTRERQGNPNFGSFFWNRVISLYADADEWERALHLFKVRNKGASISWMSLVRLLRSLSRAKEWGLCEELVRDVAGGRKRGEREGILGVEDYGKAGQRGDGLDDDIGTRESKIGGKDGGIGGKKVWEREIENMKERGFIRPEESSWDQAFREGGLVLGKE